MMSSQRGKWRQRLNKFFYEIVDIAMKIIKSAFISATFLTAIKALQKYSGTLNLIDKESMKRPIEIVLIGGFFGFSFGFLFINYSIVITLTFKKIKKLLQGRYR